MTARVLHFDFLFAREFIKPRVNVETESGQGTHCLLVVRTHKYSCQTCTRSFEVLKFRCETPILFLNFTFTMHVCAGAIGVLRIIIDEMND